MFRDAVILGIDTTASGAKIAGGVAGSVGSIVSGGAGVSSPTEEERRQQPGSDDVSASTEEGRRQQADMGVMLQEEKKEEKEEMAKATKRRYLPATELLASLGGMAMIVMIGTRAYMYFDEHSFVPALYFTVRIASARASARATGSVAEVRGSARAGHHGDDCRLWRHCAAVCRLPDLQHHLRADRSRVLCQRSQRDQWHPAPAEEGETRRLCRLPIPADLSAFPFKTGATAYLIMREGRS